VSGPHANADLSVESVFVSSVTDVQAISCSQRSPLLYQYQ
jgi:hypothetical protein